VWSQVSELTQGFHKKSSQNLFDVTIPQKTRFLVKPVLPPGTVWL
jgi:hypothetical protein